MQGGALLNSVIDKFLDDADLTFHHHRSAVNIAVCAASGEGNALAKSHDSRKDGINELLLDRLINKQSLDASAVLTTVLEATSHGPWYDVFDLDIITEHHRVLSTELQDDWLEILARSFHYLPSDTWASSEDDFINIVAGNKGGTSLAETSYGLHQIRIMSIHF